MTAWTHCSRTSILGWLAIVVWLVVPAALSSAGERSEARLTEPEDLGVREQILWFGPGESRPIFIPESRLADSPLESAPVSDVEKDVLRSIVEKFQDSRWGNRCDPTRNGPQTQGSADEVKNFEGLLREQEIVFVGEIVEIVPGWSSWLRHVARMVYVEVQDVLRGETHDPGVRPGQVVGLHFVGGSTRVAGTLICEDVQVGFYQPVLGDRVLVGGEVLQPGDTFFFRRVLFPILGGEVLAQPYPQLDEMEIARDLRRLGRRLEGDREQR